MFKSVIAALAVAILATPVAMARDEKPVTPCAVKVLKADSPEYKRFVRDMRRQGYRVEVFHRGGKVERLAEGGEFAPVALRHANVPASGCN